MRILRLANINFHCYEHRVLSSKHLVNKKKTFNISSLEAELVLGHLRYVLVNKSFLRLSMYSNIDVNIDIELMFRVGKV